MAFARVSLDKKVAVGEHQSVTFWQGMIGGALGAFADSGGGREGLQTVYAKVWCRLGRLRGGFPTLRLFASF